MKSFNTLLVVAVFLYLFSNRSLAIKFALNQPVSDEGTRGAIMQDRVSRVTSMADTLEFGCQAWAWPSGYGVVADQLGLVLLWGDRSEYNVIDDRVLGQANSDTVWMFVPPCHPWAPEVFFHEIGHAVLDHSLSVLPDKEKQDEADYFSLAVLESIGRRPFFITE